MKTFGCTLNYAESKVLEATLRLKHRIVSEEKEADVVIVNTCAVKHATVEKVVNYLRKWVGKKRVIVGGCFTADPRFVKEFGHTVEWVMPQQLQRVAEMLGVKGQVMEPQGFVYPLPIQQGCKGVCTFCFTRVARRHMFSVPIETVVEWVKSSYERGVREVQLSGTDLAYYGLERGEHLVGLLKAIATLPLHRRFKVRVGMMNPAFVFHHKEQLAAVMTQPHFYKFIHIPVQSGSDEVLRSMRRAHNVKVFEEAALFFKAQGFTVATDIIVGYPTESEEDFERTLRLIERVQPHVVNVSKFSPRPLTPAARLKPLPSQVVKERTLRLLDVVKEVRDKYLSSFLNKEVDVLVTEKGRNFWKARTDNYVTVLVKEQDVERVRIVGKTQTSLIGE